MEEQVGLGNTTHTPGWVPSLPQSWLVWRGQQACDGPESGKQKTQPALNSPQVVGAVAENLQQMI